MGLDQYAYAQKGSDFDNLDEKILIAQWRKHANLQGWMEDLYRLRGGTDEFNCVSLRLSEDDILRLGREHRNLSATTGFFFGETIPEKVEQTEEFIDLALSYISKGYAIVYSSWW
jgi:hypothetical protein